MKLGILGTGMIVKEFLKIVDKLDLEYVAILGRETSREKTESFAAEYHLDACFFDYEEMLSSEIDTVYVALPNFLHFSFAKQALMYGKHVIMEKPITANYREFCELKALAEEKGCMMIEAVTTLYLPAFERLKSEIEKIGKLKIINLNFSQYSTRYGAFKEGTILPAFDYHKAGGALMDINVYNLHFAVGLFGMPVSVSYHANIEKNIDTSGIMVLDYGTFKAVCIGAKDCQAPNVSTIQGDKGNIVLSLPVNQFRSYELNFYDGEQETRSFDTENHRLYYEFCEFVRIINEKDGEKVKEMLEISDAVAKILEDGRGQEGIIFDNDK